MNPMESTAYLLQHVANVLQRQTDQVLQERLGIGMAQYRILLILTEHHEDPEPIDQKRVADSLGQTEASISRQVKLLQERGMLALRVDSQERRRHVMALTTKGIKVTRAAEDILEQYQQPLLAELSDKQQAQFRDVLGLLHEYTCAPGKPMACDRAHDITALYNSHKSEQTL